MRSWQLNFFDKEGSPAAGFVHLDETGIYNAMFLPSRDRRVEVTSSDFIILSPHKTVQKAKGAVERYAKREGYVRTYPGQAWRKKTTWSKP